MTSPGQRKAMCKYLFLLLVSAGLCLGQNRDVPNLIGYSAITTNGASALSWAFISARGKDAGAPALTFVSATTDKVGAKIQCYKVTATTFATITNTTTAIPVAQTNGFAQNDIIIIRHLLDDSYEKRTLGAFVTNNALAVSAAPLGTVKTNDVIYRVTTTGAPTWPTGGALTNSWSGPALAVGQGGYPLLVEVDGTSSATLNLITAIYLPGR